MVPELFALVKGFHRCAAVYATAELLHRNTESAMQTSPAYRQQADIETLTAHLVAGNIGSTFMVPTPYGRDKTGPRTLAQLVSDELCDITGNPLHDILYLIGAQAQAGNQQALAIVDRLAKALFVESVEEDADPVDHDLKRKDRLEQAT